MATITLKGNPLHTIGSLPSVGSQAPDFVLTTKDLSDVSLKNYAGKHLVLNLFPSMDTPTCATSVRRFNEMANKLDNTVVLCISADLPFAQKRFCTSENLENIIPLSVFRSPAFGKNYGVTITDGPLAGLLARSIVVIDSQGKISYTELVGEIADEPNYQAVLAILQK